VYCEYHINVVAAEAAVAEVEVVAVVAVAVVAVLAVAVVAIILILMTLWVELTLDAGLLCSNLDAMACWYLYHLVNVVLSHVRTRVDMVVGDSPHCQHHMIVNVGRQ
jgi:hypothetical protein